MPRTDRPSAVQAVLLAAALALSAQEGTWLATYGALACALAAIVVWGVSRGPSSPLSLLGALARRAPLLLLLPAAYFAALHIHFVLDGAEEAQTAGLTIAACVCTYFSAALLHTRSDGRFTLNAQAAAGACICLQGLGHEAITTHGFADVLANSPFRRDLPVEQITRLNVPIAYPNALATVLLFFSACSAGSAVLAKRITTRAAWIGVFLLHCFCILLTGSHGGVLSLLLLPLAYIGREVRGGRWIAGAGGLLGAAAVAWMLRKPYARLRGSGSLLQRAHGWIVTLKIVTRSPWFGEGPNAFAREWAGYGPAHGYANQFGLDGYYANLLCEGGVVSLTVLSTLVIAAARETRRLLCAPIAQSSQTTVYYLAAGLGAVIVHNLVETTLSSPPIVLSTAVLFGIITALRTREARRTAPASAPENGQDRRNVAWSGTSYSSGPRRSAN